MSRLKNFARNLAVGYIQLGVNVVYSLVSVPLILHWLPKAEFGLWATLVQLMAYIAIIDLGITSSVARLLVDYKDRRVDGGYGSLIKTAFLVSLVQGFVILVVVLLGAPLLASVMRVPPEYERVFIELIRWQGVLALFGFAVRPLGLILYAHQRMDIGSNKEMLSLALSLGVLVLFLSLGSGIYAFLYSAVAQAVIGPVYLFWHCRKLDLIPRAHEWGKASWRLFGEIFNYGKDVFLMNLGSQMIMASQTIIVSRSLGLEVAAVWAIGTKTLNLVIPLLCRPLGAAFPGLFEMIARGELERLRNRFKGMVALTCSLGVFFAVGFALCNSVFVTVWTHGRIVWSPVADVLLGLWIIIISMQTTHSNFVSVTKEIGGMRYVFFVEGCCFVVLATMFSGRWGLPGVAAASSVCTILFSLQYSLRRSRRYFGCSLRELVFSWSLPGLKLALALVPLAVIVWYATVGLGPWPRLCINSLFSAVMGGVLFLRLGVPRDILQEADVRFAPPAGRFLRFVAPQHFRPKVRTSVGS